MPEVRFSRARPCSGYHDHNFLTIGERLTDHLAGRAAECPRERLWRVRAKQVVLATGAIERPLVFGNNDRPGIMLASAVSHLRESLRRAAGRRAVVFTNNDALSGRAGDPRGAGDRSAVVDLRPEPQGPLPAAARGRGNRSVAAVMPSSSPTAAIASPPSR